MPNLSLRRLTVTAPEVPLAMPAGRAARALDAELIELGIQFAALLIRHYDAFVQWAPLMFAHNAVKETFGIALPKNELRREELLRRLLADNGCDELYGRMQTLYEEMVPLADEIKETIAFSFDGLRAKALVLLWEILPARGSIWRGRISLLSFPVAEVTGLMPIVRGIQKQLAAQVGEAVQS